MAEIHYNETWLEQTCLRRGNLIITTDVLYISEKNITYLVNHLSKFASKFVHYNQASVISKFITT